ncbi:MAG TPA: Gfo/Idh/MocA family oxidoreductase [Victivallales bacterium]|nr:Gfo/Idh/MocA family oxidoreductase [Victivallales bacterium]
MNEFKIAIIGASGHFSYFRKVPDSMKDMLRVTAISSGGDNADSFGGLIKKTENFSPTIFDDYRELLEKIELDAVIVNPEFHRAANVALDCVKADIPVFMEKPFGTELKKTEQLHSESKKRKLPVFPMFDMRYQPTFFTAQKLIKAGRIGDPVLASAQKSYKLGNRADFYKKRQSSGGMIPWVAIHAVDFIRFVTGLEYQSVNAKHTSFGNKGNGDLESSSAMIFECQDGRISSVTADYLQPRGASSHGDDRLRVAGTKGIIEIIHNTLYLTDDSGSRTVDLESPPHMLFEDFIRATRGEETLVTPDDGFIATYSVLAARESADFGEQRKIITPS